MKQLTNLIALSFLTIGLCSCENEPVNIEELIVEIPIEEKLPQVFINTNGAEIVDEPKINAEMTITVNDEIDYTGAIGIEIRGSSSQMFPKKQFGFETRDAANEDMDVSLLGFPEEEDWILYAPYSDKSLMRNILMYDLSREIGRYASRAKFVDVTINESYNGVYLLFEKLKRDNNRIDINKLKDDENDGENLTGGYILKIDKAGGSDETLYTSTNSITSLYAPNNSSSGQEIHFLYDSPDEEDITTQQRTYISNYLASFEDALASSDFTDYDIGYNSYIDTQSFIDFFLLNELSNNVDGYRLSTWLVKDKNEKLKMGPIWDFDLGFGNVNYAAPEFPTGFWVQENAWIHRMLEDPSFALKVKMRFSYFKNKKEALFEMMDEQSLYIYHSQWINNSIWNVLGQWVWPNAQVFNSYEEEVLYLKDWIELRLDWLEPEINKL